MAESFLFYDLETSGINPREDRIMQFAAQRTNLELDPIGEPVDIFIKLPMDVLPHPQAILLTGITPQKTIQDGVSEADFLKLFYEQLALANTIFVGYNSVRFDDEFLRYLHYRNFYDPYEWQWKNGRSRWDLLDLTRMTRALRPENIEWPLDAKGRPTNRLETLTTANGLEHSNAHNALSDVMASIEVARLINNHQPKLFSYLLQLRDKKKVAELVMSDKPFVYTSGKYPSEFEKTSIVTFLSEHPKHQGALIYDLRYDPNQFIDLSVEELVESWIPSKRVAGEQLPKLPVKTLQFNRCPALAPLSVMDETSLTRIGLDMISVQDNYKTFCRLRSKWLPKILEALKVLDQNRPVTIGGLDVDSMLYDGFFNTKDRVVMESIHEAKPNDLDQYLDQLSDKRLKLLLPLYKARNFPKSLTNEEHIAWQEHLRKKLLSGADKSRYALFTVRIQEIAEMTSLTAHQKYLLEELDLWAQSIMPSDDFV